MEQITTNTKRWLYCAGIRAVKTMAQTFLAMVGTATVLEQVNWKYVLSAVAMAGVLSLITSLAGLPEVEPEE